jgi:hypothetical protein
LQYKKETNYTRKVSGRRKSLFVFQFFFHFRAEEKKCLQINKEIFGQGWVVGFEGISLIAVEDTGGECKVRWMLIGRKVK